MSPISLTEPEQWLVEHVVEGTLLDFSDSQSVDEAAMRSWGDDRTIRAEVIREILLGRLTPERDPRGLRLRGAKVTGRLDVESLRTDVPLHLYQCLMEEGLIARDARLPALILAGSCLSHPSEPAVDASRLTTGQLSLTGTFITADNPEGAVRLLRARISDSLGCQGADLRNDSGPAIRADGLLVDRNLVLSSRFTAIGAGEDGTVRLVGSRIGGDLICFGATLRNGSGPALVADKLHVDQSLALVDGFSAAGTSDDGAVRLVGARIGGQLSLRGAILHNRCGPALLAEGVQVDESIFLRDGFTATGDSQRGTVTFAGARIRGDLVCSNAILENRSGPALDADGAQVGQNVVLHTDVKIIGAGEHGAVRVSDAQIAGKLGCSDATIRNDSGSALDADRIQVKQGLYLDRGLKVTGAGEHGAVRLTNARIDDEFQCVDATLQNRTGPALSADGLYVAGSFHVAERFHAVGSGTDGAVRMLGARIGGHFQLVGASLRNDSGPALSGDQVQVERNVVFADAFYASGAGKYGTLRLSGMRIGGQLSIMHAIICNESGPALTADELHVGQSAIFNDQLKVVVDGAFSPAISLLHAKVDGQLIFANKLDDQSRLDLDGLVYSGLPSTRPDRGWLDLVRYATPRYAAQPYQQLAAAHRAAGHDAEVRRVLMAQRQDQIRRGTLTGWRERAWARFTGLTLGYGYQPWRALVGLLAVIATVVILSLALGDRGGLTRVDPSNMAAVSCSTVEQISVGLSFGLPLISTGAHGGCAPANNRAGDALTVLGWGSQLLAWGFATLFVAGFTGAVRKT